MICPFTSVWLWNFKASSCLISAESVSGHHFMLLVLHHGRLLCWWIWPPKSIGYPEPASTQAFYKKHIDGGYDSMNNGRKVTAIFYVPFENMVSDEGFLFFLIHVFVFFNYILVLRTLYFLLYLISVEKGAFIHVSFLEFFEPGDSTRICWRIIHCWWQLGNPNG